jgi:hypothetical protein
VEALKISPELEPLKPLILSQHEVFSQSIQDLGLICLTLTKLIRKKERYSLLQLKNNNKIPRGLCLKYKLTKSPAYTDIMTTWAEINIQLLVQDCCFNIISKALQILDGLTSYNTEIIGMRTWPSAPSKYTILFLLKLYFSNMDLGISELVLIFNLPSKNMLLIGTKILLNTNSDEEAIALVTLVNFDNLRITTINIWSIIKENYSKLPQPSIIRNLK